MTGTFPLNCNIQSTEAYWNRRGIYPVSRLINYHPQRVAACAFLGGGYSPPPPKGADLSSRYEMIKKAFGYDAFAYMRFFIQPDAPAIIEEHVSWIRPSGIAYSYRILIYCARRSTHSSAWSIQRKSSCGGSTCVLTAARALILRTTRCRRSRRT